MKFILILIILCGCSTSHNQCEKQSVNQTTIENNSPALDMIKDYTDKRIINIH